MLPHALARAAESAPPAPKPPPAPLFRDPIYDGAADPTLIWNRDAKEWWMLYTQRRANQDVAGVAWCHGTDIGIAASTDGGNTWIYRGVAEGLKYKPGRNTYWAPEIIWHDGRYHMYVSFVPGVPQDWIGDRYILHYTSANALDWNFQSKLDLSSNRVIDACVERLLDGRWRMWYKDEVHRSHIYAADSKDLSRWEVSGPVITDRGQEGPNVFRWKGAYWMITDMWAGLGVFRSKDGENWAKQRPILDKPGKRPEDGVNGQHAFLLAQQDEAYIFYFTHPDKKKRTSIQVARLAISGEEITCDRDGPFTLSLDPTRTIPLRGGTLA